MHLRTHAHTTVHRAVRFYGIIVILHLRYCNKAISVSPRLHCNNNIAISILSQSSPKVYAHCSISWSLCIGCNAQHLITLHYCKEQQGTGWHNLLKYSNRTVSYFNRASPR